MRTSLRAGVAVVALLVAGLAAAAAPASGAPAPASGPAERYWGLEFTNVFKNGTAPLYFYARERDGVWKSLVGSSRDKGRDRGRTFNKSWYCGDFANAPIRDGALKGRVTVHLAPDSWVPTDHKSVPLIMDVDARVEGAKMTGTWKLVSAESKGLAPDLIGKGGQVKGDAQAGYAPVLRPDAVLRLNMHGSLVGGNPAFGDRCMVVLLGMKDGQLADTMTALLDTGGRTYGNLNAPRTFRTDGNALSAHADLIKGRVTVPGKTLDALECQYIFDFQGSQFAELLVGTYRLTAKIEGKPDVIVDGSFDGAVMKSMPASTASEAPIVADVKGFVPVQPGEHPRLLFRKADLPALRQRAQTPEGKAIIERLRHLLGNNGETFPPKLSAAKEGYPKDKSVDTRGEMGYLTLGHAAGYGLLYQVTEDRKYADLGRKCFETWMTGVRDPDPRYSFDRPNGQLRSGASWAVAGLGYDLCHDGWDPDFRRKVAEAFLTVQSEAKDATLKVVVTAPKCAPAKNHFGGIICGAAAAAAIMGDPGTEKEDIAKTWIPVALEHTAGMLTRGFGDHGFFAEGHGPSHVSSDTGLLLWLRAARIACGKDFITPAPNAQWITLRWVMEMVPTQGLPVIMDRRSSAGGSYGTAAFERDGPWSHSGQFSQGFAATDPKFHPAMLWVYEKFVEPAEFRGEVGDPRAVANGWLQKGKRSYDAIKAPWHAVMSFVGWPVGVQAENPEKVMPRAAGDSVFGYYMFRNRWQDADDIVVTALLGYGPRDGYVPKSGPIDVRGYGQLFVFGDFTAAKTDLFEPRPDGSGLVLAGDKQLAVDMSGASGAGLLLASIGIGGADVERGDVELKSAEATISGRKVTVTLLARGAVPATKTEGDKIVVGGQTISFDGKKLVLAR